jgi:hypothetical protein
MSHTKFFKPSLFALSIAGLAATGTAFAIFNDEGTDYAKAKQRFHLWNEALQPVEMVNSILCFTHQMRAEEFINAGPYMVLADENACFKENGGEDSQSSGSSNQPAYTKAIITSERENIKLPACALIVTLISGGDSLKSLSSLMSFILELKINSPTVAAPVTSMVPPTFKFSAIPTPPVTLRAPVVLDVDVVLLINVTTPS